MSQTIPPAAILVEHTVANYDAWKKAFDQHQPARAKASALGHHLNRDAGEPNHLYIYCPVTDMEKAKSFAQSADLAETMQRAGVVDQPKITFMVPKSVDFIADQQLPAIIVKHPVRDYATWRKSYDAFDDFRKKSGIVGHAVNQEAGHPNQVIVYHQAKDPETLRRFVESPELKDAMEKAGVSGPPEIHFVRSVDFAEY